MIWRFVIDDRADRVVATNSDPGGPFDQAPGWGVWMAAADLHCSPYPAEPLGGYRANIADDAQPERARNQGPFWCGERTILPTRRLSPVRREQTFASLPNFRLTRCELILRYQGGEPVWIRTCAPLKSALAKLDQQPIKPRQQRPSLPSEPMVESRRKAQAVRR
jgi:hypothetical protein